MSIDVSDFETVEKIRIPRKKMKSGIAKDTVGDKNIARLTDPSVKLDEKAAGKAYAKFGKKNVDVNKDAVIDSIKSVDWGDFDIEGIIETLINIGEKLSDKKLFDYQKVHVRRIFRSVLRNEGARLTTLLSRQSGKSETTAIAIVTLCVSIPALAEQFPDQLGTYKHGFRVGVFAPNKEQSAIIMDRVLLIAKSSTAKDIYEDPDIDTELLRHGCQWSNGSWVKKQTADPKANIEGLSLDLIVIDESQDIDDWVVSKSIMPMGAWNNATVVHIGTTNANPGYFYNLIQSNKVSDMNRTLEDRKHTEFDYRVVTEHNPRYAAYVENEIAQHGVSAPFFRMNFCLQWMFDEGSGISDSVLKDYALQHFVGLTQMTIKEPVVVGIDIGSDDFSSVVTVGKIIKNAQLEYEDFTEKKSVVQLCDWLELNNVDHPSQRPLIREFLSRYRNIVYVIVDETGVGKAALQEMKREWPDIRGLEGLVFSPKSKAYLRSLFEEYLYSNRIVVPSTPEVRQLSKWQNWYLQMINLQKVTKKGYTFFERKQNVSSSRDDYPDSFFLMLHGASKAIKNDHAIEIVGFDEIGEEVILDPIELLRKRLASGDSGVKQSVRQQRVKKLLRGII